MSKVNHPKYYGGEDNLYETIKVIDAWDLDFSLGNAVKYISRAGKKETSSAVEDLEKAIWYLQHAIENVKEGAYLKKVKFARNVSKHIEKHIK